MLAAKTAEVTPVAVKDRGQVLTGNAKVLENGIYLGQALLFLALTLLPAIAGGLVATKAILREEYPGFAAGLVGRSNGAESFVLRFGVPAGPSALEVQRNVLES